MASTIRPIPAAAAAQIASSAQLTSLNEVVVGLVQNALDAGASRLRISLDYTLGNCAVEDDGYGIMAVEFTAAGGLGKPHHTSKLDKQDCHGHKGNFLTSLAALALVTIASRHKDQVSQNSLVLHKGQTLSRNTPSGPTERSLEFQHGTRVKVEDLFGVMPVRVRQRATVDLERQWSALTWNIIALLVCWPKGISVMMTHMQPSTCTALFSSKQKKLRLRPVDERILAVRTPKLFAQVNLADDIKWEPVSASAGGITVKGCISHTAARSKKAQLISLGVVPVLNSAGTSLLYEKVNNVFIDAAFAQSDEDTETVKFAVRTDGGKRPRKGLEKWPMFYFRILFPGQNNIDKVLDTPHVIALLADLLSAICKEFLEKTSIKSTDDRPKLQPMMNRPSSVQLITRPSSVASRSSLSRPRSAFDTWSRMKVGQTQRPKIQANAFPKLPLINNSGNLTRPPFEIEPPAKRVKVDMTKLASQWKNPVFETSTSSIPRLAGVSSASAHNCTRHIDDVSFDTASMTVKSQISKDSLQRTRVLSQVDEKFILVSIPKDSSGSLLVIVDQHAADERARLEELMASYFPSSPPNAPAHTEAVESALYFEVSAQEGDLLIQYQAHFRNWGIHYTHSTTKTRTPDLGSTPKVLARIAITSLPPSIHARCIQDPALLITLLRAEIWAQTDSPGSSKPVPRGGAGPHGFVARFRTCPVGILDLLNSRACRSAVMFNDPLSHTQCCSLLDRLARCAFPFQCAHGRPAMVPLVDLAVPNLMWGMDGKTQRDETRISWKEYIGDCE
ncbi:hypothetical protein BROUX41_005368 [Berkeleyomyces rouxiae]|uniref:uncharacterized protein n=1 Tax=Berkeleyomyces rouxiae TaxID=2035830 RepID=UPI003B774ED0